MTWANDGLLNLLPTANMAWGSATVGAALLLADGTAWAPAQGDANLAAVIAAGAVEMAAASYARVILTGQLVDPDGTNHKSHQSCDVIAFGPLEAAFDYDTLVIYLDGATDADRTLLLTFDISVLGSPRTTDGADVNVNPNVNALWDLVSG